MAFDRGTILAAATWPLVLLAVLMMWNVLDRPIEVVHVGSELSAEESAAVIDAVRRSIDGGVLSTDIDEVAKGLRELSWPRTVAIRRIWPDRLEVDVTKVTLIARWRQDQYLTSTGAVVRVPEPVNNLPMLDCAIASPVEAMEMYGMLRDLAAEEQLELTALEQNRIGEWQIRFANLLTVNLGAEKVIERMQRFAHAYRNAGAVRAGTIAYVDTRYPNGVAIRFNELLADGSAVPK